MPKLSLLVHWISVNLVMSRGRYVRLLYERWRVFRRVSRAISVGRVVRPLYETDRADSMDKSPISVGREVREFWDKLSVRSFVNVVKHGGMSVSFAPSK